MVKQAVSTLVFSVVGVLMFLVTFAIFGGPFSMIFGTMFSNESLVFKALLALSSIGGLVTIVFVLVLLLFILLGRTIVKR